MDPTLKKITAAQAILEFEKLEKRLNSMSLLFPQNAHLATVQADAIADLASKLVSAVTNMQTMAQQEAKQRQHKLELKLLDLGTQATRTVQHVLQSGALDSSRTVKANFRLIFGPANDKPYSSTGSQYRKSTKLERIETLRNLSATYPHGVIAFSIAHSSKVWAEAGPEVFNGLVNLIRLEQEHDWPTEIFDIMDELQNERPMVEEFGCLRAFSQPKASDSTICEDGHIIHTPYQHELHVGQSSIECSGAQAIHAGEVYALTEEDLREIAGSGQTGGEIVLTIPLAINTPPFVNVLVSNQLSRKFSRTRGPPTKMHIWRALLRTVWWK